MTEIRIEDFTKDCPTCGSLMRVRTNKDNGGRFMGCTGYPISCTWTEPIPQYVLLKAAGAKMLPGFE